VKEICGLASFICFQCCSKVVVATDLIMRSKQLWHDG